MRDPTYALAIVALGLAVIIVMPMLVIWALNTLFPVLAIAHTLQTWAAIMILFWVFKPSIEIKKS